MPPDRRLVLIPMNPHPSHDEASVGAGETDSNIGDLERERRDGQSVSHVGNVKVKSDLGISGGSHCHTQTVVCPREAGLNGEYAEGGRIATTQVIQPTMALLLEGCVSLG